ncbi:MAG: hypothetical protein GXP29_15170 [Planctomycetes bacterium]|nr:hypothetical protein [Planctomycetota bacterium]
MAARKKLHPGKNVKKRKTAKQPDDDGGSSSYSTRFEPQQRELVEEAAGSLNISPAKLIREAAVRRAADVLNADSGSRGRLRVLARAVVCQIMNPSVKYQRSLKGSIPEMRATETVEKSYLQPQMIDEEPPDDWYSSSDVNESTIQAVRPDDKSIGEIESAFASCPTEFSAMILEALSTWWRGESYTPKVQMETLLNSEETDK